MKILMEHPNDYGRGGGNIAMYRLHLGLRQAGIDSAILCADKKLESADSVKVPRSRHLRRGEHRLKYITGRLGLNGVHNLSVLSIKHSKVYLDADVIHFHCIHGGFVNYLGLPLLTANKPAVSTLHDMWYLTGHCSYSYDCDRWKIGYRHSNLTFIVPSTWIVNLARKSMLSQFPIHQIPHGVDTEVYQPLDSNSADPCLEYRETKIS